MQGSPDASLIRVALVEDDAHFRDAFAAAIAEAGDMTLVSVASTRAEGMKALQLPPADVLLVDLGLPDGSGIDVIRAAQILWPACHAMVSTTFGDEAHVIQSIEAGAAGYLLKDSVPRKMVEEIRRRQPDQPADRAPDPDALPPARPRAIGCAGPAGRRAAHHAVSTRAGSAGTHHQGLCL